MESTSGNEDFTFVGIFKIHTQYENLGLCNYIDEQQYQLSRAFKYSIAKINSDRTMLSGITLGYTMIDSCGSDSRDLLTKSGVHLNSNNKFIGLFGTMPGDTISDYISTVSQTIPVVSSGNRLIKFGDRGKYPQVFRTVESNWNTINALIAYFKARNWTQMKLVWSDTVEFNEFTKNLIDVAKQQNICVTVLLKLEKYYQQRYL